MTVVSQTPSIQSPRFSGVVFAGSLPVTLNLASAQTFTAAQLLAGIFIRDCNGAARADTFPTAAAIVAALQSPYVGQNWELVIMNTSAGAFTTTIGAGVGVTLVGTQTVAQLAARYYTIVITNVTPGSEAVTIYSVGGGTF